MPQELRDLVYAYLWEEKFGQLKTTMLESEAPVFTGHGISLDYTAEYLSPEYIGDIVADDALPYLYRKVFASHCTHIAAEVLK